MKNLETQGNFLLQTKWFWHALVWTIYFGLILMGFIRERDFSLPNVLLNLTVPALALLIFYLFHLGIWKWAFRGQRYWLLLLIIPLAVCAFVGARFVLEERIYLWLFGFDNYNAHAEVMPYYFYDNYMRILPFIAISGLVYLVESRLQMEQQRALLQAEKTAAEMALLRTQLNPHFLFNTLSYLYTEAFQVDEKLAGKMLHLSEMLRYTLQSSTTPSKTIAEEIELIEHYLSIFRNRFSGKCFVEFKHQIQQPDLMIEPMLFISFIENAFKHGIIHQEETPVRIQLLEQERQLQFSCRNHINQHQKDPGSGIGIQNVKKRLALRYPAEQYQLHIEEKGPEFIVHLNLSL